MDDYLGGADPITRTTRLRDEIMSKINSAGFPLRKCISNNPQLLKNILNIDNDPLRILNLNGNAIKTLGSIKI